jgi:disulfide oxidoreductase YuzD
MDVAVYIKKSENEPSEHELPDWLQTQLQEAYKNKNIKPEQITVSDHCVTIAFPVRDLKLMYLLLSVMMQQQTTAI